MRLTPAQVGMSLLLGRFVARLSTGDLKADIRRGREWLVRVAPGQDFGYDAIRWHEYLWATDAGGYKWSRRNPLKWERHVRIGMTRPGWAEAVRELEAEDKGGTVPGVQ
jgi:hypothetical protein